MTRTKGRELLKNSLAAETKAVRDRVPKLDRFLQADAALEVKNSTRAPGKKVVRDAFTLPEEEHALIQKLREKVAKAGCMASKSEIMRAGLKALAEMGAAELEKVVRSVEKMKPGRKRES